MTVAIIGHHKIAITTDLVERVTKVIKNLIESEGADTFLFGSRSDFDDLCYDIITELRYKYTYLKRIYVRSEYRNLDYEEMKHMLARYEDTFFSDKVDEAGRPSYVVRNEVLVLMCDVLIVYCSPDCFRTRAGSGTKTAIKYAQKKNKRIINVFL